MLFLLFLWARSCFRYRCLFLMAPLRVLPVRYVTRHRKLAILIARYTQEYRYWEALHRAYPDDRQTGMVIAQQHVRNNNIFVALRMIKNLLRKHKDSIQLWSKYFTLHEMIGHDRLAQRIVAANPDHLPILCAANAYERVVNHADTSDHFNDYVHHKNQAFHKIKNTRHVVHHLAKKYPFFAHEGPFCVNFVNAFHAHVPYTPKHRRILYVVDNLSIRGSEFQLLTILQYALHHGYDAGLFVRLPEQATHASLLDKVPIAPQHILSCRDIDPVDLIHPALLPAVYLRNIHYIIGAIQKESPSIVHVRGGGAAEIMFACRICRVPRVIIHLGSKPKTKNLKDKTHYYIYKSAVGDKRFTFVFNCRYVEDMWRDYLGDIPHDQRHIIPNYVQRKEHKKHQHCNTHIIGGMFRLSPEKNIEKFIDIASFLPEYIFHIYGTGIMRDVAQRKININHLQHRVILKGETPSFPEEISLLLHTSVTEGLSNSILEALAHDVPVLASDVGGTPEIDADMLHLFDIGQHSREIAARIPGIIAATDQRTASDIKHFHTEETLDLFIKNIYA